MLALQDRRIALAIGAAAVAVAIGAAAIVAIGVRDLNHERHAAAREARANATLQTALAQLRDQVVATSQQLRTAQGQIAALGQKTQQQMAASEQAASSKTDRITQLAAALDQAQRELHLTEAQRATLLARLSMAEAKHAQRQETMSAWQQKVDELTADRDRAARERDELRARLNRLGQKTSLANPTPAALAPMPQRQVALVMPGAGATPTIAGKTATSAVAAAQSLPSPGAPTAAPGRLAEVERVLASAGVDVKRMFADVGVRSGLGGPFVPMPRDGLPDSHVSAAKLAALPGLLKSLPVGAPMEGYRETSPFGERVDPFNGRSAFHPGVDLAAPYGSAVYATAAGVVTFAGWSGAYGKIVEINHGHGIVTRYGHLERPTVLVGERVATGTQIGYEGSTGRSTGPHVIYEIDVNGEPQDPAKFMNLARVVAAR